MNKDVEKVIAENQGLFNKYRADKPWVKLIPPETAAEKYVGGTLENWYIVGLSVTGDLFGDDRWSDGQQVTTSYVVNLDVDKGYLETRNTVYGLGKKRGS